MKRAAALSAPALWTFLTFGCAPADVSGEWDGEWKSGIFSGGISMSLTQEGDTVEGTFDLDGTGCVGSGSVSGTVNDRQVSLVLENQVGGAISIDGKVGAANDRLTGDFEVTGGWCENTDGTVELTHQE